MGKDHAMKKAYETSQKARTVAGWHKHLRPAEKRRANKSTRKLGKLRIFDEHPSGLTGEHDCVLDAIYSECLHNR